MYKFSFFGQCSNSLAIQKIVVGHQTQSGTWENHQMMSELSVVSILNFIDIQWSNIVPASNGLFSTVHDPRAIWCVNLNCRDISYLLSAALGVCYSESHLVFELWTTETYLLLLPAAMDLLAIATATRPQKTSVKLGSQLWFTAQ
jgi:hypothetical protein